jgi:hypothetical protein
MANEENGVATMADLRQRLAAAFALSVLRRRFSRRGDLFDSFGQADRYPEWKPSVEFKRLPENSPERRQR